MMHKDLAVWRKWLSDHPLPLIFMMMLLLCGSIVFWIELQQVEIRKERTRVLAMDTAADFERTVEHTMALLYTVSILLQNGDGKIADFPAVAKNLMPMYPQVETLQLAPDGIIQEAYPLAGNESVIGHDLFSDPEAEDLYLAKESGMMALTGPFLFIQGWKGYVGSLPVYLTAPNGEKVFWGFAGITVRHERAFANTLLRSFDELGYAYRLTKYQPETGEVVLLDESAYPLNGEPVEHMLKVPGARWILRITRGTGGWIKTSCCKTPVTAF